MKIVFVALVLAASTAAAADRPTVYVQPTETSDASNATAKAKNVDFGAAVTAALIKKEVPVSVLTDPTKAQWTIRSVSSQREDSTGTKFAKIAFAGSFNFTKFEGSVQVIDNTTSAVIYAYNVKKGNFQSAADAFAKHFKNDFLAKRP